MSLYQKMFGDDAHDPDAATILTVIGLMPENIDRFRGAWWDWDERRIVVLTRTGGDNRDYSGNHDLTTNPYYLGDEDDEDDPTYAYYYFAIPSDIATDIEAWRAQPEAPVPDQVRVWLERTMGSISSES